MILINLMGEKTKYELSDIKSLFKKDSFHKYKVKVVKNKMFIIEIGVKYPINYILLNPTKATIKYMRSH